MRRGACAVLLLLSACGERAASDAELPCAIERIVSENCAACHGATPGFGAPMSLASPSDFHAVRELVRERIQSDTHRMPPPPNPPLTASERATLLDWLAAGAPAGDACATPATPDGGTVHPLGCEPDLELRPAGSFSLPKGAADLTVCYGVTVPSTHKLHVIGFAPHIDNQAVLHHMSLLQTDVALPATPALCPQQDAMQSWRVVYGWAPGATSFELPAEAGFAVDPGTSFVVQLHYVGASGGSDASGFDLCTSSELRQFDADIMAFGTHEIFVPPHAKASARCSIVVPAWGATVKLFASFPHMHRLGTSFSARVLPDVDIGSVPAWDFDRQTWLAIDHVLTPGDVVETECVWNNPNPWGVGFGPSTDDEMCYGFSMYYPRIEDPSWHWMLPALGSECTD
jgi:hypothetical protein